MRLLSLTIANLIPIVYAIKQCCFLLGMKNQIQGFSKENRIPLCDQTQHKQFIYQTLFTFGFKVLLLRIRFKEFEQ